MNGTSMNDLIFSLIVTKNKDIPKKEKNKIMLFSLAGAYKNQNFTQLLTPLETVGKAEEKEKRKEVETSLNQANVRVKNLEISLSNVAEAVSAAIDADSVMELSDNFQDLFPSSLGLDFPTQASFGGASAAVKTSKKTSKTAVDGG